MNKVKFLHRKGGDNKKYRNHNHTKNRYDDEQPYRESIRNHHKHGNQNYFTYSTGLNFTPVDCYINKNINRNWNDIYSEIIKKIRPKYRWKFENYLNWYFTKVIFVDYKPYRIKFRGNYVIAINCIFIDDDNIVRFYKNKEKIEDVAKKKLRRDKILKLFEVIKINEIEETLN